MNDKLINNWLNLAEYDFKTAEAMLSTARYLYVAFTCQQTVEKILKAIYIKEKNNTPPYSHNLLRLLNELTVNDTISSENKIFLIEINQFYIETRYTEKLDLISDKLDKNKATEIFNKTKDLFSWLKEKTK